MKNLNKILKKCFGNSEEKIVHFDKELILQKAKKINLKATIKSMWSSAI